MLHKRSLLLFSMLLASTQLAAQLNMSLVANISYDERGNDIWGWVAPDGTEYALMGLRNGISIVSLADPPNATEVAFVPGQNSTWRDIKTWENFAYVTTDQPGSTEGLVVIDLSNLPNSVSWTNWNPDIPEIGGVLNNCHNLYIDEFGYAYFSGCNLNNEGVIFVDVFSDPSNPSYVGHGPPVYSHDSYVRDNILYSSEILLGRFGVYDVSDKSAPQLLGGADTPFRFTHNTWLSDNGQVLFTTDERANAPVAAYDVSDVSDIKELDQFKPAATLGLNVIPHNVHVLNDYLVVSYYTDGCIIVDANRPDNMIEVGNYDTFLGDDGGFNGAWGAYPFLPSGLVLVSDINSGLFVLEPNYVRASYLEGTTFNAYNDQPLSGVTVNILGSDPNQSSSNLLGSYKTGKATPGSFEVEFSKEGFFPQTHVVEFISGEVQTLDVSLQSFGVMKGMVVRHSDGQPVPNAHVQISGPVTVQIQTSDDGSFEYFGTPDGEYEVIAGKWGFDYVEATVQIPQSNPVELALPVGYRDDFLFDYPWTTGLNATSGAWERVTPIEVFQDGQLRLPGKDVDFDLGDKCYVTGNAEDHPVEIGESRLFSPVFDLSDYQQPVLHYSRFFYTNSSDPKDNLSVYISNGTELVLLESVQASTDGWGTRSSIPLANLIELTDSMQVHFVARNPFDSLQPGEVSLVEAGIDALLITEGDAPNAKLKTLDADLQVMPNPVYRTGVLEYNLSEYSNETLYVELFNAQGQLLYRQALEALPRGRVNFSLPAVQGTYFLRLQQGQQRSEAVKVIGL